MPHPLFRFAPLLASLALAACPSPFGDAAVPEPAPEDDGVELLELVLPPKARTSTPADCDPSLVIAGECRPFRGTFGAREIVLDDPAPIAASFATRFGAPFEQRLHVIFRTDPSRRPSEGPTASLNLELVLGADTRADGRVFECADADPLNIDPANAVDADRIVLDRDLHALQVVYFPPRGETGGLASSFALEPRCTLAIDEMPVDGAGRFRGTLEATLEGPAGEITELTDGRFDVVLDAP